MMCNIFGEKINIDRLTDTGAICPAYLFVCVLRDVATVDVQHLIALVQPGYT